jgi:hypothetical protein
MLIRRGGQYWFRLEAFSFAGFGKHVFSLERTDILPWHI